MYQRLKGRIGVSQKAPITSVSLPWTRGTARPDRQSYECGISIYTTIYLDIAYFRDLLYIIIIIWAMCLRFDRCTY